MNVTLKRDGLTLRGELLKPDVEKCPILIIFHGFMANIGKDDKSMLYQIAHECLNTVSYTHLTLPTTPYV